MMSKKAVVLLSGGLDSTTCAYLAKHEGYRVYALSFDYGQRLVREIESAKKVSAAVGVSEHLVMKFDLGMWGGSALTSDIDVPTGHIADPTIETTRIPVTYVPGRNMIFLSLGVSYAESIGADKVFIGVNSLDYSGYPDCRPEFVEAMQKAINLGTKAGVEGKGITLEAPLLMLTKAGIIELGTRVGVDYSLTWSCYQGGEKPCGACDSCLLRRKGFQECGRIDPIDI
jgi:7-cyano-7-deazaguanine synthase